MSIGYACIAVGVKNTNQKSCVLKNISNEKLLTVISHNLHSLENMIDYNIQNGISLFRISSDLIPFGSSEVNSIRWWEVFLPDFQRIGIKIKNAGMRVSMHPGQYTVLNSPHEDVVRRAILDLEYHNLVLDCLGVNEENKIILHIGGVYGDKKQASDRFVINYQKLEDAVKRRLVLENDDKSYHIGDLLQFGQQLNVPVVFDNLHNAINPYDKAVDENFWIKECRKTWKQLDGKQKMHYSQQNPLKKMGSHSETIHVLEFMNFYHRLETKEIDIMLEVKDKNLSAIKCINCTKDKKQIKDLELEWSKYKYNVLEHSHSDYQSIRQLLREQYYGMESTTMPKMLERESVQLEFYQCIEHAMYKDITIGGAVNAATHVWGYFKKIATEQEKKKFSYKLNQYEQGLISLKMVKSDLEKLTRKYEQEYLEHSYYFSL